MVISLRPPRRKITCGNWNNKNIHIDWKCMKQPMWEVPAFWLTKNSIYNVWTSTPIFVDWWKNLYLSISSGSKCRQTLRRSDTEESLDPLRPIPIIPSPSSVQLHLGKNLAAGTLWTKKTFFSQYSFKVSAAFNGSGQFLLWMEYPNVWVISPEPTEC
jgi:hypothetical protein